MPFPHSYEKIVFCDFDGTITETDTFAEILSRFSPAFPALKAKIYSRRITLREGIRQAIDAIPSEKYPRMLEYIHTCPIRQGFSELVDFLEKETVPIIVVSGGLKELVTTRLGPLTARMHAVYGAEADTSGLFLRTVSQYEAGAELVAKADIMAAYAPHFSVAIGNGLADVNIALAASVVFARDHLARSLEDLKVEFIPWDNFHDVQKHLENLWSRQ